MRMSTSSCLETIPRGLALLAVLALVACGNTRQQPQAGKQSTGRSAPLTSTADEPTWELTGGMGQGRLLYTATRLEDGRVLVAGGYNQTAELYHPASKTWSRTGDTRTAHRHHTATRLGDGRVLVAGGEENWHSGITAEVFNPATDQWSAAGSMVTHRSHHAAVLLPSGRVLVMGGLDSAGGVLASAEVYDPGTDTWSLVGTMATARSGHTATLLDSGQVLVVGGRAGTGSLASAELYDPASNLWTATSAMGLPRGGHTATLLSSGKVLVAGGDSPEWTPAASAEVYDPESNLWTATGAMSTPRRHHTATRLPSGQVLVAGGFHEYTGISFTAELYDPATNGWSTTASMNVARYGHTATLLNDGAVLAVGGFSNQAPASAELYLSSAPPQLPSGTSLLLEVLDSAGNPLPGAAISSQQALFPVDSSGHYLFENLQPGRFQARVDAHGFASASVSVQVAENAHVGYQVRLLPLGNPLSIEAGTGGVIDTGSVRVTLPPGALVDALGQPVTGPVQVTVTPLDPTTQLALVPGPLEGLTASGETVQLESLFMAEVSLWRDGAPVQLAPGASAILEFVLPEAVASRFQAGESIPAWWFDLDAGLWRKEGAGTLKPSTSQPGKLSWAVEVNHFTWWNADAPWWDKSCVNVLVVNSDGQPIPNMQVNTVGISYTGINAPTYTGADGRACSELKRGGTAKLYTGAHYEPTSVEVTVTASEEPATCGGGACMSVTLQLSPQETCTPGAYQECSYGGPAGTLGQGWCQAGRKQCNSLGSRWSDCLGERVPAIESCQLPFDEDCDGQVNEACHCSELEGTPCYGGPAGTQGVGICHGGIVRCDAFGNVTCEGQRLPQRESCSTAEDDDCDGSTVCSPPSEWLRVLGESASNRQTSRLSVDRWGNTVVTGSFEGTLDLGGGPLTADAKDLFVAKFNVGGQYVWSQVIQRDDTGDWLFNRNEDFMAVDGEDNVVLAGSFMGALKIGTQTLNSADHASIFVAKLSPTGALLWIRSFGGYAPSAAWASGIAVDATGNVLVSGGFQGNLHVGGTEHTVPGNAIAVMKLEENTGEPLWSKSYPVFSAKSGDVAVDPSGNVFVAGELGFQETINIGGELIVNPSWATNAFVVKLEGSNGDTRWGRLINTEDATGLQELPQRVVADQTGNVLVLTWVSSAGFSRLLKFGPGGEPLASQQVGRNLRGDPTYFSSPFLWVMPDLNLSLDVNGNALVSGGLLSPWDGFPGAFLEWYGSNLAFRTNKIFGGRSTGPGQYEIASGRAAATDSMGDVVFAGEFFGPVDFGTEPVSSGGAFFLLKLNPGL